MGAYLSLFALIFYESYIAILNRYMYFCYSYLLLQCLRIESQGSPWLVGGSFLALSLVLLGRNESILLLLCGYQG